MANIFALTTAAEKLPSVLLFQQTHGEHTAGLHQATRGHGPHQGPERHGLDQLVKFRARYETFKIMVLSCTSLDGLASYLYDLELDLITEVMEVS